MGWVFYGTMDVLMGQWRNPRARRWLVACGALLAPIAACSSPALCRPVTIEALDPLSSQHVIAGADVNYLTDPPTSGPHLGAPSLFGPQDDPISLPMQVTILESGRTLVQYDSEVIDAEAVANLEAIAGEQIVVAPGVGLSDSVIVTRWQAKASCTGIDTGAIQDIADRNDLPATTSDR